MNSAIERLLSLRVKDIMARQVLTISPDQSMAEVARVFTARKVSGAPVVDKRGQCVGILSSADFVRRAESGDSAVACQLPREALEEPLDSVDRHMSAIVHAISEEATLMEAARELCAKHIHRLPVTDEKEQLIGWVSSLDVVAAVVHAIAE